MTILFGIDPTVCIEYTHRIDYKKLLQLLSKLLMSACICLYNSNLSVFLFGCLYSATLRYTHTIATHRIASHHRIQFIHLHHMNSNANTSIQIDKQQHKNAFTAVHLYIQTQILARTQCHPFSCDLCYSFTLLYN